MITVHPSQKQQPADLTVKTLQSYTHTVIHTHTHMYAFHYLEWPHQHQQRYHYHKLTPRHNGHGH